MHGICNASRASSEGSTYAVEFDHGGDSLQLLATPYSWCMLLGIVPACCTFALAMMNLVGNSWMAPTHPRTRRKYCDFGSFETSLFFSSVLFSFLLFPLVSPFSISFPVGSGSGVEAPRKKRRRERKTRFDGWAVVRAQT